MADQILPSWRDGDTRDAILGFLDRVDEIPPAHRVAVFDNDGTMWAEKPNYPQLEFWFLEMQEAIGADPSLADKPEFRAVIDRDMATIEELGLEGLATAFLDLFAGITPEEFDVKVARFFAEQQHPRGVPYRQQRYQPMLELMDELRSRGFDFYLVSAGGAEFVRVISQDFYGVSPEGVVGSQIDYEFTRAADGTPRLLRTNHVVHSGPNEGQAKVPNIHRILGRRPVVAGGNSPGDAEMLEYAMTYDGPSLALLVNHDDAEREYAYESKAGTFDTEETILETAARLGWTVASIRNDWATVFSDS
ncbi:MAG: haloacid dehalogenase-like hydrolase [Acidimicrobiia bacterium]|nr:haloacid dehalogenase-like hydrolase [Acidimicrobiia bacterium]